MELCLHSIGGGNLKKWMTSLFDAINHLKIINKLMLMYVIGGLIPLLLVSLLLTSNTRKMLIDQSVSEARTNTTRIEERLLEAFQISTDVSDGLYLDDQLAKIINTSYMQQIDIINDFNNYTRMDDYLRLYSEIDSIRIYVENETLLDDAQIIKATLKDKQSDWYQLAYEKDGRMALIYKYDDYTRSEHLAVVRLVKSDNKQPLGVLVVNISDAYLRSIIQSEPYELYMTLDEENIVIATDKTAQKSKVDNDYRVEQIQKGPLGTYDFNYEGIKYKVISDEFSIPSIQNSFRLMTLIPIEQLTNVASTSVTTSAIMICMSVVISLLMVYLQSRAFSNRINSFRKDMHQVAGGDFDVQSNVKGNDELGELSNDLNSMIQSIQTLIHEVYEVRLQKEQLAGKQKEVQFKMLASQINPHFLYNALETIRMKAHVNGQEEIAVVVKKLAKIMRRNLSISNDEVQLQSELDLVKNYLEIQQFRFRDKVSYDFKIECDVSKHIILPLLLQPLVENAFVHGLERKIGQGHIEIMVLEVNNFLRIIVKDNGMGIDSDKLANLWDKLKSDALNIDGSIGLTNVNQRIKLFYGEEYQLEIKSQKDLGTEVSVSLPIKGEV